MNDIFIRTLNQEDIQQMSNAFNAAFEDYPIKLQFSLEDFRKKFIDKLNIDFNLSCGAFSGDRLVAFIFHSLENYEGKKTAYNGGTGVVQDFRGSQLTLKLYDFIIPLLMDKLVEQCILEVMDTNYRAVKVYQSVGFRQSKIFRCYKLESLKCELPKNEDILFKKTNYLELETLCNFDDVASSFLDLPVLLKKNLKNEEKVIAIKEDQIIGYAIFQLNGRISRLSVHQAYRKNKTGTGLIGFIYKYLKERPLTVMNVNENAVGLNSFLSSVGFKNELNQFEFRLNLAKT